jgi:hypothetical protein
MLILFVVSALCVGSVLALPAILRVFAPALAKHR